MSDERGDLVGEKRAVSQPLRSEPPEVLDWSDYVLSAALVGLATILALLLRPLTVSTSLIVLYVVAALLSAVRFGVFPAIFTAVLGIISFELLVAPFSPSVRIADQEYLLPLASLIAGGVLVAVLALGAHQRELAARKREREALALFELSQQLMAVTEVSEVADTAVQLAGMSVGKGAALYLPLSDRTELLLFAHTTGFEPGTAVQQQAVEVSQHNGDPQSTEQGEFYPVPASGGAAGVLVIDTAGSGSLSRDQHRLLVSFTSLLGLALARANLAETARQTRLLAEADKLQTALLNSISHDLRTPLASVTGALSSLLEDEELLSPAARKDLTMTAWEEANRLNRLLRNLLNMTRLEAGALKVVLVPTDVEELVGTALAQMPLRLHGRTVRRHIPLDLPPISIDLVFLVQALVNLIDNALKYSPPEQAIEIAAFREGDEVVVQVLDRGPGLPQGDPEVLFNKFVRGNNVRGSGTGLGLAISKGIVDAHNGRLWTENRPGGGAVFSMALKVSAES